MQTVVPYVIYDLGLGSLKQELTSPLMNNSRTIEVKFKKLTLIQTLRHNLFLSQQICQNRCFKAKSTILAVQVHYLKCPLLFQICQIPPQAVDSSPEITRECSSLNYLKCLTIPAQCFSYYTHISCQCQFAPLRCCPSAACLLGCL